MLLSKPCGSQRVSRSKNIFFAVKFLSGVFGQLSKS